MTKTDKTFAETGRWLVYLPLGYLAIRPGEIRDPRIRNIDLKKGVVVFSVDQSKNRRNPVVTIPAQIILHLAALHLGPIPRELLHLRPGQRLTRPQLFARA